MLFSRILKPVSAPLLAAFGLFRVARTIRRNLGTSLVWLGGLGLCGIGFWEMAQRSDGQYFREELTDYEDEEFFTSLRSAPTVKPGQPASSGTTWAPRWPRNSSEWPPVTVPAPKPPALEQSASQPSESSQQPSTVRTVGFQSSGARVSTQVDPLASQDVQTAELPLTVTSGARQREGQQEARPPAPATRALPRPGQAAWFVGTIEVGREPADAPITPDAEPSDAIRTGRTTGKPTDTESAPGP